MPGKNRNATGEAGEAWDLEKLLSLYRERTGNSVTRKQVERYLREGLLPVPREGKWFQQVHLERLRMLEHLRSRYGMSLRDMAGIFGVIESTAGRADEAGEKGRKADDRRKKIIENASRIFAEKGYRGTTVDDVVQATGIAKGTFYLYFGSKEELLIEVVKKLIDETLKRIDEKLRERGKRDCIARIEAKGEELLELYLRNSELLYMLLGETVGNPRLAEQLREVYERLSERIEEDLQWGVQEGEIYPYPDLRTVAYALVGMGQTVALLVSGADREQMEKTRITVDKLIRRAFAPDPPNAAENGMRVRGRAK